MGALMVIWLAMCMLLESSVAVNLNPPHLAASSLVEDLPGMPPVNFRQHAGYLTVDEGRGRALFYWLVEATEDPATKPLALWLNGGPGCSSVGGGALSEIGPFFPDKSASRLIPNPNSWNQESNVLFLETPAGVGFSYSNTSSDYVTGDRSTAEDNYNFLVKFFEEYPQYKGRDFFITGESFAGHYIPQLSRLILERNRNPAYDPINLMGMMVGNPTTDFPSDKTGALDTWFTRGLISAKTHASVRQNCDLTHDLPDDGPSPCVAAYKQAYEEMGNINLYDIYANVCIPPHAHTEINRVLLMMGYPRSTYDPCIDNEVETYLNRRDIQDALHANTTGIPYRWTDCSSALNYSVADYKLSQLDNYRFLLRAGLRVWIYSGDVDGVVPLMGTRRWLQKLRLPVKAPWRPWYHLPTAQVGGWTEEYEGLTFVTVRGAGHMVPYTQPERVLALFSSFRRDAALPEKKEKPMTHYEL